MITMRCPACGRDVVLLPPRPASKNREAVGWRRKDHAAIGSDLSHRERPGTRCRYQRALTPDEIANLSLEDECA